MQARRLQVDHRRRACVATLAALAATGGFVAASARTRAQGLAVLSFNVLAPLWAAPQWYPASLNPSVLDRAWRRGRIAAFLADAGPTHDLVCLQEVELQELPAYEQALGPAFVGAFASHDRSYWSSWLVPQLPWVPNGNALFVRRQTVLAPVFTDFSLGDTGNHAVAFTGTLASSGRLLRAASVHLDSDSNVGRRIELDALLALTPPAVGSVDIIAGDINEDTVIGSAAGLLRASGLVDVLAALGNREPTHPFRASYNHSPRWAIIDHVLARGVAPHSGDVFDFSLGAIDDEVPRIEANFQRCGSDHHPVTGAVAV